MELRSEGRPPGGCRGAPQCTAPYGSETLSVDYSEYERLARHIATTFFGKQGEYVRGFGPRNKIEGASGYWHQIDISFDFGDRLVLIECKHLRETVPLRDVLVFLARLLDIRARDDSRRVEGMVMTAVRFAEGGIQKLAKYHGISLQLVWDDWAAFDLEPEEE